MKKWRIVVPLAVVLAATLGQLGVLPPVLVEALAAAAQVLAPA